MIYDLILLFAYLGLLFNISATIIIVIYILTKYIVYTLLYYIYSGYNLYFICFILTFIIFLAESLIKKIENIMERIINDNFYNYHRLNEHSDKRST